MKIAIIMPDNRDEFRDYCDPEPRFGTAPKALLDGFAQIANCEVHVICCVHRPLRSPAKLAANIWYHSLVVPRWGWRAAYLGCVWALRKKLHELQPDVVHGQGTERYCALAAALSGLPNVITIHGNMRAVRKALRANFLSFHGLAAFLEVFSLRLTGGVVCLTTYTKEQVEKLSRRVWIVPNAVDSRFFKVVRALPPKRQIVCVGIVDARKNQHRLIEALDDLAATNTFTLVFAGAASEATPYGAKFFRLCSDRAWCEYTGTLSANEIQKLFSATRALILSSLEDNCPMVILEAMAAGVPVAASRIGGIPDLIEDGVTGLMFDPASEASIQSAVGRLLDDPASAEVMAERARTRAKLRFSSLNVAQRHLEIYRELLGNEKRLVPR